MKFASLVACWFGSVSFWEWVEYAGTAIVIVGVVGETIVEFSRFPKSETRRKRLVKASALILIAGLAVELLGLVRTNLLSERRIAELDGQTAQARAAAAQANAAAESEKLERVKLEAQVEPRRLTPVQRKAITDAMTPFAGRPVSVASYSADIEGAILAKQLVEMLGRAGLRVQDDVTLCSSGLSVGILSGIAVSGTDTDLVNAITKALGAQMGSGAAQTFAPGTNTTCSRFGRAALPTADVFVGWKPIR